MARCSSDNAGGELTFAFHIRQPHIAALIKERQLVVIHAQQTQDGGVHIMRIDRHLRRLHAEFVGRSEYAAALHASARHPHGEAIRMMVAAVIALRERGTSEFPAPDYERGIEQPAALQILKKAGDRYARHPSPDLRWCRK